MQDGHNFVLGGCRIISITDQNNRILYLETNLGSESEIPVFIEPGKESSDMIEDFFCKMEDQVINLNEIMSEVTIHDTNTEVFFEIEMTQFDLKDIKEICGMRG